MENRAKNRECREVDGKIAAMEVEALQAARCGDWEGLRRLLELGMSVELGDEKGNRLLMLAAYHDRLEVVRGLLAMGADADGRNARGHTPLAGVAFKGYVEVARELLRAGADAEADQGGGKTPAMFAAMFGNYEVYEMLMERVNETSEERGRWWLWAKLAGMVRQFWTQLCERRV